jgi:Flp pilus assembly protein TadD
MMSKGEGLAIWRENQRLAEENYRRALSVNPRHSLTYRGLGKLYEKQQRNQEAVTAYRQYLALQPGALDRVQIAQRIDSLQRGGR